MAAAGGGCDSFRDRVKRTHCSFATVGNHDTQHSGTYPAFQHICILSWKTEIGECGSLGARRPCNEVGSRTQIGTKQVATHGEKLPCTRYHGGTRVVMATIAT